MGVRGIGQVAPRARKRRWCACVKGARRSGTAFRAACPVAGVFSSRRATLLLAIA